MDTVLLRTTESVEDSSRPHLAQLFVRSQSVVSRRVAGETLIVPVRGKVGDLASIYSFNSTGSLIWQSLESPKCFDELVNVVESEYAVERDQAEQDVKQFLQDMLAADLVQIREPLQMVG
ncbi:MAG: PqqD family protein [Candidatus Sulfotelmatobacter sp.]